MMSYMKNFLKSFVKNAFAAHDLRWLSKTELWRSLNKTEGKKKTFMFVLLPSDYKILLTNVFYAKVLHQLGHNINFVICDGLEACELTTYLNMTPQQLIDINVRKSFCRNCSSGAYKKVNDAFPGEVFNLSEFSSEAEESKSSVVFDKETEKEIALCFKSGSVRYNAHVPGFDDQFFDTDKVYETAAQKSYLRLKKAMKTLKPDVVVGHHGIYVPMGLLPIICRELELEYLCWNFSYRDRTVLFSHKDSYHRTLPKLTIDDIKEDMNLEIIVDKSRINNYLTDKLKGSTDWVSYYDNSDQSDKSQLHAITKKYKFIHAILTNILWDAYVNQFNGELPFEDQMHWLLHLIELAKDYPTHAFVIRVHPAEVNHPIKTRVKIQDLLKRLNIPLADNVFILSANSNISSHELIRVSRICHVFSSKVGLEAVLMHKPVTVSGDAWIRNKQIGYDISTVDELEKIIKNLDYFELTEQQLENAYLFAEYFFNYKSVFLPVLNKNLFAKEHWKRLTTLEKAAFPIDGYLVRVISRVFVEKSNF